MPPQFEEAKLTEEDFKKEIPNITPQSRFANNAVNDKWAAILFIAHLFVTLAYAASGIIYNTVAGKDLSIFPGDHDLILIIGLLSVSVLVGIAAALFFYFFTLKKPLLLIQISMIIYVGFFFAYAIGMIVVGVLYIQYVTGIFFIIFGCFFLLFALVVLLMLFLVRKTFALTAAYFKISAEILAQFHGMVLICVLSIGVYLVFAAFWMSSFICTLYYQYPVVIFIGSMWMLFSWFWATQVIVGVVRVTVAGVVGHWYYEDQNMSGNSVVIASFRRAIFTSFGSICFGALITAALNSIYAFYRFLYAANRNSQAHNLGALIFKLIVCCFLIVMMVVIDRVRRLMKFFNNYAFTFVAVYGLKYTDAGYATLKLLVTKGLEAVMAAGCLRIVAFAQFCTIGMISLAVTSGLLGLLYAVNVPLDAVVWSASLGLSFAVSVGIGMISTEVVAYCIPAILICTANEPSKMPTKTPELYELLRTKFPLLQVLRDINIV